VVGDRLTLIATTNQDVGPTPFYILIYDAESKALLKSCLDGFTCSYDVTQYTPQFHHYIAYVAGLNAGTPNQLDPYLGNSPPNIQAHSDSDFYPSWLRPMNLTASRIVPGPVNCPGPPTNTCAINGAPGLVSLTTDTGGVALLQPWNVYIYNLNTGNLVGSCRGGYTSYGGITSCDVTERNVFGTRYWAVIARNGYYGLPYSYGPQNDFRDGSYYADLPPL
jgi:hypothetical protein